MAANHAKWLLLLAFLCLPVACGGGGGGGEGDPDPNPVALGPEQAFGGPAPAGAVSISPEEFAALLASGKIELITKAQIEEQEEDALEQMVLDRARAEQVFADRMEILERHTAEPDPADPDYERLPDGSWRVPVIAADPASGREEQHAILQGRRQAYAELADTEERYRTAENHLDLYGNLHAQLDRAFIDRYDLPDPGTVTHSSFEELEALNLKVAQAWTTLKPLPSGPPVGHPGIAANEEGHGGIDDAEYRTHTGMWPQIEFPLKWYTTSVKAQGERGTCVAFGITAAVETIVARDQSRWVDLSEQMLYNRAKQKWWPSTYGDGLNTAETIGTMLVRAYRYSWERSWDYNTSPVRLNAAITYLKSCLEDDGTTYYAGKHCSNTNHQAEVVTTETILGTFCACMDPATDVPPDAKFALGLPHTLGGPGSVQLLFAKVALVLGNPVIVSVTVGETLRGDFVGQDGIVPLPAYPFGSGGHCMLLVGYIENVDLPPGTQPGSGGGYFVCKNSWGSGYGDAGYCYIPDAWLATWARGFWTLDGVLEF